MREKTRDAIQKALFEAFFVVLAVALALAANEWRQGRADRAQARGALASVVEELKTNRAAVKARIRPTVRRLLAYSSWWVVMGGFFILTAWAAGGEVPSPGLAAGRQRR